MMPIHDRVLVKLLDNETKTKAGIILPTNAQDQHKAEVVAIGPKVQALKIGQTIKYYPNCGTPIEYNGVDHLLLKESTEVKAIL